MIFPSGKALKWWTENVICQELSNCAVEDVRGSKGLSSRSRMRRRTQANWLAITLAIIVTITIALIIPVFQETDIHIQIGYANNIMNVWVDTPSKPLISRLFPPSYALGTYTLNVTITTNGQNVTSFSRTNVPVVEYVIIWQNNIPAHGFYTITVNLYNQQLLEDTYTITISF